MNLAVFRDRRFVRFEVSQGHLEPGCVRVPVKIPAQPPHVPSRHYLWSTCRLNEDGKGATIHYSVHDRPQAVEGSEAPQPAAESSPQSLRLLDDTDMSQRLDDLNAAIADMSASILRQQQEIGELRSALAVAIRALDAIKIEDSKVKLQLGSGKQIEVVSGLVVHKAVLSRDDQDAIRKVA